MAGISGELHTSDTFGVGGVTVVSTDLLGPSTPSM